MKLSQLYSNKQFENIVFNDGLNLVLTKVSRKTSLNTGCHNPEKNILPTIIDFMLLKQLDDEHIFKKYHERFWDYTFYLEILLNNGVYLTIKRSVNNPEKISFKSAKTQTTLLEETVWDKSDLPFAIAVETFNNYLGFNQLQSSGFRQSATHVMRSQKDYSEVFKLSQSFEDIDWKPFMLALLGFNGELLIEKYKIDKEISNQKTSINGLKNTRSFDTDETDKIKRAISLKKTEQAALEQQINNFNFYQQERTLNKKLVRELEKSIAELNSLEYNLEFDLEKTKQSFSRNFLFDIDRLKEIYHNAEIFFPDNLVKDYTDLQNFNIKLSKERNKYLKPRIVELSAQLKKVRRDLRHQNKKRNQVLSLLKDNDSFKKFKTYQIDLIKTEGEISRLQEKLKSIDKISIHNEVIDKLSRQSDILAKEIKTQINSDNNKLYPEIRRIFYNIFKQLENIPAIISIKQNTQGNIDFKAEISRENKVPLSAEEKGNTHQKLLCMSFDLAILAAYHNKSFYRFVFHDGALNGLDNRQKTNFIQLIQDYCTKYDLQYILTCNEDDMPPKLLEPQNLRHT